MPESEQLRNSAGQPVCGVPCHYGGLSAARKYSAADLGYIWRCNRVVSESGQRCYQHKYDDLRHEDDDGR